MFAGLSLAKRDYPKFCVNLLRGVEFYLFFYIEERE